MQFEKLGPYLLGKKLGQGGMGAVYQGVDESTGHIAAIKVLSPHLAGEEGFRARFEAEIESLKKLRHPNIVRLFGYGEEGGHLFYAMELVRGTSLEDELRAGRRFDWREVTRLTIDLCKALKHAHDSGIIHRDIKPANLLLSEDGVIHLSDFGIARLFGNSRMTQDGGVLGTAEYMAPEQADGRPVTERCDQYSLGGVMYALLAGRPPFRAPSLLEMLQLQRFAEPQPVRRYAPDTPTDLESIILQLLAKDPQRRFANVMILARGLEAMERGLSLHRDDFVVPDEENDASQSGVDAVASTMVMEDSGEHGVGDSTAPGLDSQVLDLARKTQPSLVVQGTIGGSRRFIKVEDGQDLRPSWGEEFWRTISSWQTLGVVSALLAIGMLAYATLRPPTVDELYDQIEAVAAQNQPAALKAADAKLKEFLSRFPDDPRTNRVRQWSEEVAALKQQRRAGLQTLKLNIQGPRSPVERAYRDALSEKANHPDLALARLRAVAELYGPTDPAVEPSEWVSQARAEAEQLEKQLADDARTDLQAISDRLDDADRLQTADPTAARKIRSAIVTLYAEKPWAAAAVARASQGLQTDHQSPDDPAATAVSGDGS